MLGESVSSDVRYKSIVSNDLELADGSSWDSVCTLVPNATELVDTYASTRVPDVFFV